VDQWYKLQQIYGSLRLVYMTVTVTITVSVSVTKQMLGLVMTVGYDPTSLAGWLPPDLAEAAAEVAVKLLTDLAALVVVRTTDPS